MSEPSERRFVRLIDFARQTGLPYSTLRRAARLDPTFPEALQLCGQGGFFVKQDALELWLATRAVRRDRAEAVAA